MNEIIEKDILTVEEGVIFQSVNAKGPMGGLAGAIKQKWPKVETEYLELLKTKPKQHDFLFLGTSQMVEIVTNTLSVCNVFGQLDISTKSRQTEYCAIHRGLEHFKTHHFFEAYFHRLYFPYLFGCGKGGGDWKIVSEIINYHFPQAKICKLT
jgi:O-acetyl-ADP-ribose deacetylase (regulator of RNase III)